jgi:signal transduction histidine kinase
VPRPLSLGTRLALAFGGLFLLTSAAGALLTVRRAAADAEDGFRRGMSALVRVMPAGTGVNPAELKKTMGVDVAGFLPGGTGYSPRLVTSLPADARADLEQFLAGPDAPAGLVPGPVRVVLAGRSYQVFGAWRNPPAARGEDPPPSRLAMLLVPQERFDAVRRSAAAPVLSIAVAGAAAAVVLAWVLAATVSRPVRRLADEARRVSEGELRFRHVTGGGREIEELSASLETMTEALARSREELVRSERAAAAGQMAAALAHEVRNPLTGAKMTLEMRLAEEQGEAAAEELRAVLDDLRRLEMVVDELVSFARPAPPVFARVELGELAAEVLGLLGRQLDHAHVSAEAEVAEGTPPARADRNKVKQVLVNLVLNAMQAQPRGGEIRVRVVPADGGLVAVEVADRGPGVAAGELEKIFAPFYTTKQGGAGLGLAVSRSVAAEHGGSLSCRQAGGGGAVFRLDLEAWKE